MTLFGPKRTANRTSLLLSGYDFPERTGRLNGIRWRDGTDRSGPWPLQSGLEAAARRAAGNPAIGPMISLAPSGEAALLSPDSSVMVRLQKRSSLFIGGVTAVRIMELAEPARAHRRMGANHFFVWIRSDACAGHSIAAMVTIYGARRHG